MSDGDESCEARDWQLCLRDLTQKAEWDRWNSGVTVKNHVFGIFENVGVSTSLGLALYSVNSERRQI
jgi:hypothetical protein